MHDGQFTYRTITSHHSYRYLNHEATVFPFLFFSTKKPQLSAISVQRVHSGELAHVPICCADTAIRGYFGEEVSSPI